MNSSRSDTAAVSVEGLTKRYGRTAVVDGLSFTVRSGAVTGFLGPNGAGKTTVLKAVAGLVRPTAGRVLVRGGPVVSDARVMGVHIEPCGAHPGRTARAHLRTLAVLAGLPRARVGEVLELVGLEHAAARRVGAFSLGMRQRLGLASALLGDPEILVLDEPVNGLDPQTIRRLRTLIRERARRGGTTLLSSHILSEAVKTVDDVVIIDKGRLVRAGTVDELSRQSGGVTVHTPDPTQLAALVADAGGRLRLGEEGALHIDGLSAASVAALAHRERILLEEITSHTASLEDVFHDLTEGRNA
ncbi:ABC transporter ATP-binding protein [Streptomycetaceae bacterium NBC_01309]